MTLSGTSARNVGTERLVPLLAAIERSVTKVRDDGNTAAEAEMRHELALLLREYAALLAGKPLRAAVHQGLQALRLLRGTAPSLLKARIHHLIGLAARDAGYADGLRDRERALIHLERARQFFLDLGRPDRAAESAFSAIDAWADRRIGDPTENFSVVRASWQEGRRLFRQAGAPFRAFACDITFVQCLFRRRHQRLEALKELVRRLGKVVRALAELPVYPLSSPEHASRRQLFAEALSLLGATHAARSGRARFSRYASEFFSALLQFLDTTDSPSFLATHRLRLASYALAEAQTGRVSLIDAEEIIVQAIAASRRAHDPAKELTADYLRAQILAEAGRDDEGLPLFRAVAARRKVPAAAAATVLGWEGVT